MPYERELSIALEAAREAGAILRRHYEHGTKTWEKSKDNPVTLADLEADKAIADRLGATFPEAGEYVIEITFDVEGTPETIPFGITIGQPTATASILGTTGGGLALFFVCIRAIKIKRKRRRDRIDAQE